MAERRMFTKKIINTDAFISMPLSSQCLYFHLSMSADDEGFVGSPKTIQRAIGASDDDMKLLLAKRFVLGFTSGIIVIKHWYLHNYLQSDRVKQTTYVEEKKTLAFDEKHAYTEKENEMYTKCIQNVYIDKNSIDIEENRLEENRKEENRKESAPRFTKPTVDEIANYCKERNNGIDAQHFFDFYESKGWLVGKNKMKDWKACVRTWEQRSGEKKKTETTTSKYGDFQFGDYV